MIPVNSIRVLIVALCLAIGWAGGVAQAAPYSAIVMDMRNGKVLHARNADRRQHPASLTKMMTLYLTFEAIRDGRLRLDQRVRVSRHAARQPASKLYLRAGQRVTIRSLIRATAIKSANDAAMALAEAVGGSQRNFARMMTRKAKRLGMRNTAFRNPHGLTQRGHYSSARDMAILGRRLFFDFPQYYNIFKRKSSKAAGKRIWTTNRLLSTYQGADGIKTGYTRAAGYNLVASARRGNQRIIGVVFGARSSSSRARQMAHLLDIGFNRSPRKAKTVRPRSNRSRVIVARSPLPKAKPRYRTGLAALSNAVSPTAQAAPATQAIVPRRPSAAPRTSARPIPRPTSATEVARATTSKPVRRTDIPIPRSKPVGRSVALSRGTAVRPKGWAIQVGAYKTQDRARHEMAKMRLDRLAQLRGGDIGISPGRGRGRTKVYRIRVTGLTSKAAAAACRLLRSRGRGCAPIAPGSW